MAKILVCDDAAFMRMTLIKILKGAGHEVIGEAGNGLEAIQKYKELNPDIVLMDIVLGGGMDGVTIAAKMKEIHDHFCLIFISQYDNYYKEDMLAQTAEVNARKKCHPNYFTDEE